MVWWALMTIWFLLHLILIGIESTCQSLAESYLRNNPRTRAYNILDWWSPQIRYPMSLRCGWIGQDIPPKHRYVGEESADAGRSWHSEAYANIVRHIQPGNRGASYCQSHPTSRSCRDGNRACRLTPNQPSSNGRSCPIPFWLCWYCHRVSTRKVSTKE